MYPKLFVTVLALALAASAQQGRTAQAAKPAAAPKSATSPQSSRAFPAEIVMRNGKKLVVSDLRRIENHYSSNIVVDESEPAPGYRSFAIDTGDVQVIVPFEIIQDVKLEERKTESGGFGSWLHATVRLGDGSTLTGQLLTYDLEGQTSIGKLTIDTTAWWRYMPPEPSIASITFNHKADVSFSYSGRGRRSMMLHKVRGGDLAVEKTALHRGRPDRSGYYQEMSVSGVRLSSEVGTYEIEWDRLASLTPKDPSADLPSQRSSYPTLALALRDGQTAQGRSGTMIEGAATVAGSYKLRVLVPLSRGSFTRIDLQD